MFDRITFPDWYVGYTLSVMVVLMILFLVVDCIAPKTKNMVFWDRLAVVFMWCAILAGIITIIVSLIDKPA